MELNNKQYKEPLELFTLWFDQAKTDDPDYHHGMSIATVNAKQEPSVRVVFLKEYDEQGFVFYTNYNSNKGNDLANNPNICANFWWKTRQRQVRISGVVSKVPNEQSDQYFHSRPRGSQLAAICSKQSQAISSFNQLKENYEKIVDEHKNKTIDRPAHWGGYRIKANRIEFWQGLEHRLHHRLVFEMNGSDWHQHVIQP
ncbi:MAG: pyridoxamine 5'-phosphate oxidase [Gammaproteobacteria bacterium]|nr:pyridoxamine 5'-phosphate oxidase [Gammaproteobacteria bacterium]